MSEQRRAVVAAATDYAVALDKWMESIESRIEGIVTPPTDPPVIIDPPIDPPVDAKPVGEFKIFHQMRYKNQPDLRKWGVEPLPILYQSRFFDGSGPGHGDGDYTPAVKSKVEAEAKRASGLTVLDIEGWWQGNGSALDPKAIRNYIDVATWWRNAGGPKMGFYSAPPVIRNYWAVLKGGSDLKAWQDANSQLRDVAKLVDATFPSCYCFYEDRAGWVKYASAQVSEAKRVAPDLPCYPYLWPEYHSSNKERKGDPIEADYWELMLETMKDAGADGAVIWTISGVKSIDFEDIPPWWGATVEFAKANGLATA